jgi:hypothetical protein
VCADQMIADRIDRLRRALVQAASRRLGLGLPEYPAE